MQKIHELAVGAPRRGPLPWYNG